MNAAVSLMDGLGLDGDRCIRVIPRHPPFSMKEEALPACKETIVRNIPWSLRDRVMQQIWMYYKEKLTKNLADLKTFETSMSLRDRVTAWEWTLIPCLFTYVTAAGNFTVWPSVFPVIPAESGIPSLRRGSARPYLVVNRILIYSGGLGLPHQQGWGSCSGVLSTLFTGTTVFATSTKC